jgi:hydrogenase maturation protease
VSGKLPGNNGAGIGPETILFGIGNSGRSDDGLGWAFLDRIQQESEFRGRIEYRYQLQVEDAALISRAERVIFVDSYKGELPGGIQWKPCKPSKDFEFTTHVLPPRAVMYICEDLYRNPPRANVLMIQGSSWDLRIGMSPEAELHLDKALRFFKENELT